MNVKANSKEINWMESKGREAEYYGMQSIEFCGRLPQKMMTALSAFLTGNSIQGWDGKYEWAVGDKVYFLTIATYKSQQTWLNIVTKAEIARAKAEDTANLAASKAQWNKYFGKA